METLHTDSTDSSNTNPDEEALSDYVKQMETDQNLQKLAERFKKDLQKPGPGAEFDSTHVPQSAPDLSYQNFQKKKLGKGDQ